MKTNTVVEGKRKEKKIETKRKANEKKNEK